MAATGELERARVDDDEADRRILADTDISIVFDAGQRRALMGILGGDYPKFVPALILVVIHARQERNGLRLPQMYQALAGKIRRLRAATKSCRAALEALDGADCMLASFAGAFDEEDWLRDQRVALEKANARDDPFSEQRTRAWRDYLSRQTTWLEERRQEIEALQASLDRIEKRLTTYRHQSFGKPGRKTAEDREAIALDLGERFTLARLPIMKSADGIFAKTLAIAYEAAGCGVPVDLFRDVARVVRFLSLYRNIEGLPKGR